MKIIRCSQTWEHKAEKGLYKPPGMVQFKNKQKSPFNPNTVKMTFLIMWDSAMLPGPAMGFNYSHLKPWKDNTNQWKPPKRRKRKKIHKTNCKNLLSSSPVSSLN